MMKTLLGVIAALGLSFVLSTNTAQARVYVSGGISFSQGPISVGIYSGPRYRYHRGYNRYYPYYYYPRYHRYYPNRYYRNHYQRPRNHHHRRHRSW